MEDNTHTNFDLALPFIQQQEGLHVTARSEGDQVHFDYRSAADTRPFLTKTLSCSQIHGLNPLQVGMLVISTVGVKA